MCARHQAGAAAACVVLTWISHEWVVHSHMMGMNQSTEASPGARALQHRRRLASVPHLLCCWQQQRQQLRLPRLLLPQSSWRPRLRPGPLCTAAAACVTHPSTVPVRGTGTHRFVIVGPGIMKRDTIASDRPRTDTSVGQQVGQGTLHTNTVSMRPCNMRRQCGATHRQQHNLAGCAACQACCGCHGTAFLCRVQGAITCRLDGTS